MIRDEGWLLKDGVEIPEIQTYTFKVHIYSSILVHNSTCFDKLALFVIASCGFGLPFSWNEPPSGSDGSLSLQEALRIASEYNLARTTAPKWFWKLPIGK